MIIVVEGQEGGGKSTLIKKLADELDWPVLKIKYGDTSKEHKTDEPEAIERMKRLGIPAHTYVEDVFAAMVLAELGSDAILDRSLPSGIAYGAQFGELDLSITSELLDVWGGRLQAACQFGDYSLTPMYVYIDVQYHMAVRNCTHDEFRYTEAEFEAIGNRMRAIFGTDEVARYFGRYVMHYPGMNGWPSWHADRLLNDIERGLVNPGEVTILGDDE